MFNLPRRLKRLLLLLLLGLFLPELICLISIQDKVRSVISMSRRTNHYKAVPSKEPGIWEQAGTSVSIVEDVEEKRSAIVLFDTPTASEYSSYSEDSSQSENLLQGPTETIWVPETSTRGIHVVKWLNDVQTVCHAADFAGQQDSGSQPIGYGPGGRSQKGAARNTKRSAPDDKKENHSNNQYRKKRRRKGDLMTGLLACPFAKFDPKNYRDCWEIGYDNSHHLKYELNVL